MACAPAALVPAPASAHALALAPALFGTFPEETFTLTPTPAPAPAPALALSPALPSTLGSVYTLTCYWHFWCLHSRTFTLAPSRFTCCRYECRVRVCKLFASVFLCCYLPSLFPAVMHGFIVAAYTGSWTLKQRYHYDKNARGLGNLD